MPRMPFNDLPNRNPKPRLPPPGASTQTSANQVAIASSAPSVAYGLYANRKVPSVFGPRRRRRRKAAATPKKRRSSKRKGAKRTRRARLVKGSAAAKRFMAKLRAKRRKK